MRLTLLTSQDGPRKTRDVLLVLLCLGVLTACRPESILRSASHEQAFQQRYVNKTFYTAIVLRPYDIRDAYLIDLTGDLADAPYETLRASITVPLGTPVTITALAETHVLAHINGYPRPFRFLLRTKRGTMSEVTEELQLVLSETVPLQEARPAMRPFITRQEVTRGMSRREIYMSWGQPDKVISSPGVSGFLEEWVYFDRRIHLFLSNGFLTNWQQL